MDTQTPVSKKMILREVGTYFFRLGCTGFGGPLATVAQMERDLSGRWISQTEFAQAFAAIKTLPGPVAFQTAIFVAHQHGKKVGVAFPAALIAAFAFLLPATLMMLMLGLSRSTWVDWVWTKSLLVGLQASALGLIAASLIPLAQNTSLNGENHKFSNIKLAKWIFGFFGFAITLFRPSLEPVVIVACGLLAMRPTQTRLFTMIVAVPTALVGISQLDIHSTLFFTCLKAGSLVFGSGLAIVPLLGGEFVDKLQWLTQSEFLEAIMFGQITPGPVMVTSTYIGARVAGISGGLTATLGIFLIPFIHMTTWFPKFWDKISQSSQWKRFSFGALSAVIGALGASAIKLLEPLFLAVLELDGISWSRPLITVLLWLLIGPSAFVLILKKKFPAWAVVLSGGFIAALAFASI